MPRLISSHVRSFGRFITPFTLTLERRGLVLVEGENHDRGDAYNSNGAGKSMLFEAVKWNLTNKLARYGDATIGGDEVCWDDHPADVETIFQNERGIFRPRRRRTPSGRPTLKVDVLDANYEAAFAPGDPFDSTLPDGAWTPLEESGVHADLATDDLIKLLGFDDRALRNAILLQGSGLDMSGSTFGNQMRVLESVLRFDDFTRAAKYASDRAKALFLEAQGVIEEIERWSDQAQQARAVLTELEELDESARESELIDEVRSLRKTITRLSASHDILTAHRVTSIKLHEAYATEKARLEHHLELHQSREQLGEQCDVCLGDLSFAVRATLIENSRETLSRHEDAVEAARRVYEGFTPQLAAADDDARSFDAAARDKRNADRELQDVRKRATSRVTMIQTQQHKIDEAEQHMADLTGRVAVARRSLHVAQAWSKKGFEELKAEILGAAAPVLNSASDHFSSVLSDGYPRVEFNTMRESRSENLLRIRDESGIRDYKSFSNGERRRIDIIVALTLRECARWRMRESVNIAVWDEVLDGLDESGLRRALDVLQRDLDELESVFLITHNRELRSLFPAARTIRVVRRGGISSLQDAA